MKTLLLFCLLAAPFCTSAQQQLPNSSYETWVNTTYGMVPAGDAFGPYVSSDSVWQIIQATTTFQAVKRVTGGQTGTYAMCLQEGYISAPLLQLSNQPIGSFLMYGGFDQNLNPLRVQYNSGKPTGISGFYKLTSATNVISDSAEVFCELSKNGTPISTIDTILSAQASSWKFFFAKFPGYATISPDSVSFILGLGTYDDNVDDTTTKLYFDNVMFVFPTGIRESVFPNPDISIYPNPARNDLHISLTSQYLDGNYSFSVVDINGKVMQTVSPLASLTDLSLKDFTPGIYYLQVFDRSHAIVYGKKFLVE